MLDISWHGSYEERKWKKKHGKCSNLRWIPSQKEEQGKVKCELYRMMVDNSFFLFFSFFLIKRKRKRKKNHRLLISGSWQLSNRGGGGEGRCRPGRITIWQNNNTYPPTVGPGVSTIMTGKIHAQCSSDPIYVGLLSKGDACLINAQR